MIYSYIYTWMITCACDHGDMFAPKSEYKPSISY